MNRKSSLLVHAFAIIALQVCAQNGLPLWTNRYDGPGGGYDQANALAVDANGNVIVTGSVTETNSQVDCATIKCSGAGVPLWTNVFHEPDTSNGGANAIAVNSNGDVFVTGASTLTNAPYFSSRYVTIACSSNGVSLWTNHYAYGNTENSATAIAVDSGGNVIVTGNSYGGQLHYSYATVACSSDGVPLWTNRYNAGSPVEMDAFATAIAADTNGNVFVTGYSISSGDFDYATIKYSAAGLPLWTNRYDDAVGGKDYARALAVDRSGTVFVTGYSDNSDGNYDYLTVAYSNGGTPLWTNRYDGPGNGDDFARAIAVDGAGDVFVTGYSTNHSSGYDYATIKYSNAGLPLWTNRYDGTANGDDYARALAVDHRGNVFVTGYSTNTDSVFDYATVAYSNAGLPLWTNLYSAATGSYSYDKATAVAVDNDDNLFVTGFSELGSGGQDYTTIKYSPSLPPAEPLDFRFNDNQLRLDWNNAGFSLQSASDITGPFTNVPDATSPYTNSIGGPQRFFRLISN